MNYNLNSGYGQLLGNQIAGSVGPVFGRILVVLPSGDVGLKKDMIREMFVPDPEGKIRFFSTLQAAYTAATSNADDVILLSGHAAHAITTGIAWSKSRIHVMGMDGGDRQLQQGARCVGATADDTGYVIKVTGTRNSFRNIKFDQASTDAAGLTVAQFGGEGTLVKNCSFVFSVVTRLGGATTYEVIMGEDSGTFINCTFGSDTLETSAARAVMLIDQVTASQEMKSCFFKDCLFSINSSSATAHFIRVKANTDMKFSQTFVDCIFNAALTNSLSTATLTEAVENEVQAVEGNMLFIRPATNTTDFATAANGNTNIKVVAAVSVAAAIEGIAPTA